MLGLVPVKKTKVFRIWMFQNSDKGVRFAKEVCNCNGCFWKVSALVEIYKIDTKKNWQFSEGHRSLRTWKKWKWKGMRVMFQSSVKKGWEFSQIGVEIWSLVRRYFDSLGFGRGICGVTVLRRTPVLENSKRQGKASPKATLWEVHPKKKFMKQKGNTEATRAQRKVSEKWPSLAKRNGKNSKQVREVTAK